jgi:hypothetical protein
MLMLTYMYIARQSKDNNEVDGYIRLRAGGWGLFVRMRGSLYIPRDIFLVSPTRRNGMRRAQKPTEQQQQQPSGTDGRVGIIKSYTVER